MAQLSAEEGCSGLPSGLEITEDRSAPGRFMARVYRDIGLAVVAGALEIPTTDLDLDSDHLELGEAIRRGGGHLFARLRFGGDAA
jgi:hypothetical protein